MTGKQLQQAFLETVAQMGVQPPTDSGVVFTMLSEAQEAIVNDMLPSFEIDPQTRQALAPLRVQENTIPTLIAQAHYPNHRYYEATPTSSVLHGLHAEVKVSYGSGPTVASYAGVPVLSGDLGRALQDPFRSPRIDAPLIMWSSPGLRLWARSLQPGDFEITGASLLFIKVPIPVTQADGSSLGTFVHQRLVRQAAERYIQTKR